MRKLILFIKQQRTPSNPLVDCNTMLEDGAKAEQDKRPKSETNKMASSKHDLESKNRTADATLLKKRKLEDDLDKRSSSLRVDGDLTPELNNPRKDVFPKTKLLANDTSRTDHRLVSLTGEAPRNKGLDDRDQEEEDEQGEAQTKSSLEGDIQSDGGEGISGRRITFPERLMELLENEEAKEAMWWLPTGDAFAIQPKSFSDTILNKYFQGTKFESFTRKLNRWGFKRVAGQRVPPNTVAYYHHLFRKGLPDLVKGMSGGKKQEQDYRDALVHRELNRDLRSLNSSNPLLPVGQSGLQGETTTAPVGLNNFELENAMLRQQLMQSTFNQDIALQNLIEQRQAAAAADALQQRLAQSLAAEQLAQQRSAGALSGSDLLESLYASGGAPALAGSGAAGLGGLTAGVGVLPPFLSQQLSATQLQGLSSLHPTSSNSSDALALLQQEQTRRERLSRIQQLMLLEQQARQGGQGAPRFPFN